MVRIKLGNRKRSENDSEINEKGQENLGITKYHQKSGQNVFPELYKTKHSRKISHEIWQEPKRVIRKVINSKKMVKNDEIYLLVA